MRHIGIDLGTSNSLIAEVTKDEKGQIEVACLKNNLNKYSFSSVLSYVERNKCYFGETAEERLLTHPNSTISMIKTRLGTTTAVPVEINGKICNISPQEISATLLKQLTYRYGDKLNRAVLTKPANYGVNQNQALKEIEEISGFDVVDLIEEPSAAVMYHLFSEYKNKKIKLSDYDKKKNILVFDFGGGTLDLSLVSVENKEDGLSTKVICNEGNCNLGGELIDLMFERVVLQILTNKKDTDKMRKISEEFEFFYNNFINNNPLTFRKTASENEIKFLYKLKKELENAKIKLSSEDSVSIKMDGFDKFTISREEFERYVLADYDNEAGIKEKIRDLVVKISHFAYRKNIKIYQIVFVGGTSNIPYIRKLVTEELKAMIEDYNDENVFISNEYDSAIVKGAAILCAIKDGMQIAPFNGEVCQTIVSRKIESDYKGNKTILVNEGEEYPFEKDKVLKFKIKNALAPYQTIKFNELDEFSDGTQISRNVLDFNFYLPIYYTNDDLTLHFNIDKNGLYKMKLIHEFTGDEIDFEHKIVGSLTKNQKDEAIKILGRLK